jgi:hypothetical protein
MPSNSRVIALPRVRDPRGSLTFVEGGNHLPFTIRRAYWIYDVPGGETRAGHAYHALEEFIVALSGSFDVETDDGRQTTTVTLNRSYEGLHVPRLTWRTLQNFSTNSVALILASRPFDEADYIRDHDRFRTLTA